jgi:hypothetical protein
MSPGHPVADSDKFRNQVGGTENTCRVEPWKCDLLGIFMHANMKKSEEVIFEIRRLKACSPDGAGGTMPYEDNAGPGDLKLRSRMFAEKISFYLSRTRLKFMAQREWAGGKSGWFQF